MEIYFSQIEENYKSQINYKLTANKLGLGILSFKGVCGYGSMGNNDGEFMSQISQATIERKDILKLIVDCSNLTYQWGNYLTKVLFKFYDAKIPIAVIYSNECEGMLPSDTSIFFKTRNEALEFLSL